MAVWIWISNWNLYFYSYCSWKRKCGEDLFLSFFFL